MTTDVSETLKAVIALGETQPDGALELLEAALCDARRSGNARHVILLARHAATMCHSRGELLRALQYYGEVQLSDPQEPYAHFAVGDVCRELGRRAEAQLAFRRCLELAEQAGDTDLAQMALQALERK